MKRSKSILAIAIAIGTVALAGATSATAQRTNLNGTWVIGNGEGTVIIRGNDWFHSKKGAATLRSGTGAADYEVFYRDDSKIKCAYRAMKIYDGEALVLEVDNPTQPADYCPSGKLTRVSK